MHGLTLEYEKSFNASTGVMTFNFYEEKGWSAAERTAGIPDPDSRKIDEPGDGDNHNLFSGDDMEIVRFGGSNAKLARDRQGLVIYFGFGSAHPQGVHMAMCDGSVRQIGFDLDGEVHRRLANRRDGEVVADY